MREFFKTIFIGLCLLLSLTAKTQITSDSTAILSLTDVVQTTLENNFQIRVSRNNASIAQNNNSMGNAGMLPVVSANGAFSKSSQNTDQVFANGTEQSRNGANRQVVSAGVNMIWTVFDGTQMFATLDRLQNQALLSDQQLKLQVDNTLSTTQQLFYRVALEQERLELFQSNVGFSEERVRIVDEKYRIGKESKLSLLQAKVDLNSDRSSLVLQKELLNSQKLNLLQFMGISPMSYELNFDVEIDTTLTYEELLSQALLRNPAILIQESNEKIVTNQVQELNRARLPQIDLNLGYGYSNLESEAGFLFRNQTYDLNYGLSARVNLFNGFNQIRQIQNAQIQLENAQLLQREAEQMIQTDLMNNFTIYQNNLELRKLETQNLDVALENSEIALERFRLGVSDALELREAQINAVNAQIRFLQAQFNAKVAEIELKRIAGIITEQVAQ